MMNKFDDVNKKIASFIVLTTVATIPTVTKTDAVDIQSVNINQLPTQIKVEEPLMRYAGPIRPEVHVIKFDEINQIPTNNVYTPSAIPLNNGDLNKHSVINIDTNVKDVNNLLFKKD